MEHRMPMLTTDIIIEYEENNKRGIVLVERKYEPYGWAICGGKHELGLTTIENGIKEAKEETNLDVKIERLLGVYSEPSRDPRGHIVSIAYIAKGTGYLRAGDDAANAKLFSKDEIPWNNLAFDHAKILKDYYKTNEVSH